MEKIINDKKKEYLRIASRFLKEVGIYDSWIRYCYRPKHNVWFNKVNTITDILANTTFTTFLLKEKPHLKKVFGCYYCAYEVFGEYVKKIYPEYENEVNEATRGIVWIDREKKKVWLNRSKV